MINNIGRSAQAHPCPDDRKASYLINIEEIVKALRAGGEKAPVAGGMA
ncbi:MAG TPA: hypothetical protein VFC07_16545 [Verrucomicrobiae bacterium]|nr:hypothetical protein [Verrucomicrobiae bacterium]